MPKILDFADLHFIVAFTIGWLFTRSWLMGDALTVVEPTHKTVVSAPVERHGRQSSAGGK